MEDLQRGLGLYIMRSPISHQHITSALLKGAMEMVIGNFMRTVDCVSGSTAEIMSHFAIGVAKGTGPSHMICFRPDKPDPMAL